MIFKFGYQWGVIMEFTGYLVRPTHLWLACIYYICGPGGKMRKAVWVKVKFNRPLPKKCLVLVLH